MITKDNTETDKDRHDNKQVWIGLILVAVSCIATTGSTISSKLLNKYAHYTVAPFYFAFTLMFAIWTLFLFDRSIFHMEHFTIYDVGIMSVSGICSYFSISIKSKALAYEKATLLAPFVYLEVLFSFICDLLIFDYKFTSADILGAILVSV